MLGPSDTPFKRLEHRRDEYSGKCANASVNDYLRQHLYDKKKREEVISAHTSSKHNKYTHTISVIMLHLIIVLNRTTFTNLKHNCLFLRIFRG